MTRQIKQIKQIRLFRGHTKKDMMGTGTGSGDIPMYEMDGWMDGTFSSSSSSLFFGSVSVDEWVDVWVGVWMDGWMGGWVDG